MSKNIEIKLLTDCIEYILSNPTIPNWYARLVWTYIDDDELFYHRVAVMSINL